MSGTEAAVVLEVLEEAFPVFDGRPRSLSNCNMGIASKYVRRPMIEFIGEKYVHTRLHHSWDIHSDTPERCRCVRVHHERVTVAEPFVGRSSSHLCQL